LHYRTQNAKILYQNMAAPQEENRRSKPTLSEKGRKVCQRAIEIAKASGSNVGAIHIYWALKKEMDKTELDLTLGLNGANFADLEADLLQKSGEDLNKILPNQESKLMPSAINVGRHATESATREGETHVTHLHFLKGILKHAEELKQQPDV